MGKIARVQLKKVIMNSIEGAATTLVSTFSSDSRFMELLKPLVKPGGDYNNRARVSAVREALVCIGRSFGGLQLVNDAFVPVGVNA